MDFGLLRGMEYKVLHVCICILHFDSTSMNVLYKHMQLAIFHEYIIL